MYTNNDEKRAMKNHQEALDYLSRYMRDTVEYQNYDSISEMVELSKNHQKYSNPFLTTRNGYCFKRYYNEINWVHMPTNGRVALIKLNHAWFCWAAIIKLR